jgi:deoxyribose-phosphate aldolase
VNTEELVRLITQQVLFNLAGSPSSTTCAGCGANCEGMCVQHCPDDCRVVVSAGADRLSAPLGIRQVASDLGAMIDHTLLKPDATADQVVQLCLEARQYQFASVCLNPCWVALAARELHGSSVPVCTVVGFPLGATLPEVKAFEAQRCIADGAREVDMVINIGALKSRDYRLVAHDISAVVQAAHSCHVLVKVIIETSLLTDEEKVEACALAQAAGADYVKTSTGFSTGGATASDIALMRRVVGPGIGVKASGGIRSAADAQAMIAAGATRIGASASVKIVQEAKK